MATRATRIEELDALRGLAALAVVLYHYTTQYGKMFGHTQPLEWQFPLGDHGVHLFFIISGFVIFMTINRTSKPMDFVVSRFSRLYPPYWIAILLTTLVVGAFGLTGQERNAFETWVNLTMIQGIFEIPDVDGVYWTLLYELIFYALIFACFILGWIRHIVIFVILGALLNALNANVDWIPWKIQLFLLLEYNHLFGAGIVFYLLRENGIKPVYMFGLASCLLAQWSHGQWLTSLIITGFFVVFGLFCSGNLRFLAVKPLLWLGAISYSLYLLHQNIGYVIIMQLEQRGITPFVSISCALLFSLALAHLIMISIERPSQRWIKQTYRQVMA